MDRTKPELMSQLHNQMAGDIVRQIVRPMLSKGGDGTDVLVLLESVIIGCLKAITKYGHEEEVLDALVKSAKRRIEALRLMDVEPEGHA